MNLCFKRWKSVSSRTWLHRQSKDPFVKEAISKGYRARSAFKLLEINQRFKLLLPGMRVIECGSAPGAWAQVAVELINAKGLYHKNNAKQGLLIGCDLLNIDPIPGAILMSKADFTKTSTQSKLSELLEGNLADLVMSDMAPNATGVKEMDHDRIMTLAYAALKFGLVHSKIGASFLCKIWRGSSLNQFHNDLSVFYESVHDIKPKSSRSESAEMFLFATKFKGIER
jgi:23S rRNA (uridine2552-2'-O)-methyltransferase